MPNDLVFETAINKTLLKQVTLKWSFSSDSCFAQLLTNLILLILLQVFCVAHESLFYCLIRFCFPVAKTQKLPLLINRAYQTDACNASSLHFPHKILHFDNEYKAIESCNLSKMKNIILPTWIQENYRDSLGEFINTSYGVLNLGHKGLRSCFRREQHGWSVVSQAKDSEINGGWIFQKRSSKINRVFHKSTAGLICGSIALNF